MPHGAGVVHQRRDPAEFGVHSIEQRDHFVFDADIGANRYGLGTEGSNLLQHALRGLLIGQVVDADPITLFGGQQGGGGTDAATATSDDDDFIHASFPQFKRKRRGEE
ncbi:hypothetical protein D3C87_1554350 [compost metagenome]